MKRREFLSWTAVVSAAAYAGEAAARTTAGQQATSADHDLVLKNGRILDGAGTPWFKADIGLKGGRIDKIGRIDGEADRIIDVEGLFVSPGFLDIHSHSDADMFVDPWLESKIRQGITTELNGNCGGSPVPRRASAPGGASEDVMNWSTTAEYLDRLEQRGIALNMATLIGHGTVRRYVMEGNHGAPTQRQLDEMKELVRAAMQDGAVGLSTGLAYSPGTYAHTDEVVELASVVAEFGGIYATHLRDFSSKVLGWSGEEGSVYQAVDEAIEIGRKSGVRVVQISHLSSNAPYSGDPALDEKVRDLIYDARDDGIDVLVDVLPSDWGSVAPWPARSVFSPTYLADGRESLLERLRDPDQRAVLKEELLTKSPAEMGFENTTARLLLIRTGKGDSVWIFPTLNGDFKNPDYERKTLDVIAELKGVDLLDALFDVLVEENGEVSIANRIMEDRNSQLTWSIAMPSTDGGSATKPGDATRRVGLYMNPPEKAVVLCVDEKSHIQALDRTQPGLPMKKGRCGTLTHDYKRHGTTTLFAALNMLTGQVIGECHGRHRHQEFLKFLRQLHRAFPSRLDLHLILDNYGTHKHPTVRAWLAAHPRFTLHFTPTGASWLNLVESWFSQLTQKRIRRGVFCSVDELVAAINDYLQRYNDNPQPFVWTATVDTILEKVGKCKVILGTHH